MIGNDYVFNMQKTLMLLAVWDQMKLVVLDTQGMTRVASVRWQRPLWRDRGNIVVRQSRNYALQPWQQKSWTAGLILMQVQWRRKPGPLTAELIIWQVRWRRRRKWTWPTWARTWTATFRVQPPPPPSTLSPPSCPPSSFLPWTQSNHLEEGAVGHKRMRNHFLVCR